MDLATITAAYEGLKIGKAMLTTIAEAKIDAEAKERVNEVKVKLGDAQDALFNMREELFRLQTDNADLKNKIAESDKWNEKLAQYELTKTLGGAIVYEYTGEPEHFACPSCVSKKVIEILQDNRTMSGKFRCVGCEAEFPINPTQKMGEINYPPNSYV